MALTRDRPLLALNCARNHEVTEMERIDLGECNDPGAICALIDPVGLKLVDVGCGPAAISREMVKLGASVIGIEPDPIQAAKNREAEPVEGLVLLEGGGQSLPLETGSVDGVLFFRSLHHVPIGQMDTALEEAARVVKPQSGFICVVEPGMTGTHFAVMRPFHDETLVRTEAQAALARFAGRFSEEGRYHYAMYPRYPSFEAMVARVTGQTFNAITRDMVETDEVRTLFENGLTEEGDYLFDQPMLLNFYRAKC